MRSLMGALAAASVLLLLAHPAAAAKPASAAKSVAAAKTDLFATHERILQWIDGYRSDPERELVPDAVHAMSKLGLFKDLDTALPCYHSPEYAETKVLRNGKAI